MLCVPRGVLAPLPGPLGRWFSLSCSASTRATRAVAGGCRTARGVMPPATASSRALLGMEGRLLVGLALPEVARLESASLGMATGAGRAASRCGPRLALVEALAAPRGVLGWVPLCPKEERRLMDCWDCRLPLPSEWSSPAPQGGGALVQCGASPKRQGKAAHAHEPPTPTTTNPVGALPALGPASPAATCSSPRAAAWRLPQPARRRHKRRTFGAQRRAYPTGHPGLPPRLPTRLRQRAYPAATGPTPPAPAHRAVLDRRLAGRTPQGWMH